MASVDERVVKLEFDNSAFERKVSSTIASIGELNKALQFDGAKKGFADISSAADRFHLGGMGDAVQGMSAKFLALSTIAVTALANITTKAISAGVNIAKSLSLDQIMAGFKEYELNINSIQTILANTGGKSTLPEVNKSLDELNTYADKTIYNFGEMTKNIGTFTAAGVDLKTSVGSIKGIANLAAISGSSADQASTAMYQLSQAIAAGSLKLMDWNSVVNAGMGGKVFQQALFESGKAMKTLKGVPMGETFDQWTKKGNSFRESLKDGWITGDVLTTTLRGISGEMTDAQLAAKGYSKEQVKAMQALGKTGVDAATKVRTLTQLISTTKEAVGSGWSESFRIVVGNFAEATKLFTGVSNAIGKMVSQSADARNKLLQGWKSLGGRDLLIKALGNAFKDLMAVIKPIKDALHDVFPPITAKGLMNLTKEFSHFVDVMKPSLKTINEIKRIFEGLFSALKIGWDILRIGASTIAGLVKEFSGLGGGGLLDFAAKIGDFFTKLQKGAASTKNIKDFFLNLDAVVIELANYIVDLKDKVISFFKGVPTDKLTPAFDRVTSRFDTLKKGMGRLGDLWQPFSNAMKRIGDILNKAWGAISRWFKELGKNIAAVIGPGDFQATLDALNTALLGGIAGLIAKFLKGGINIDIGKGLFEKIGGAFDQLTGVLQAMQTKIKAEALMKIAEAIGILTASVVVLSMIDSAALTKSLTAMAVGFGQLMGAFAILTAISSGPKGAAQFSAISTGMILLSSAILILSAAVANLAKLNWSELGRGLTGVVAIMGIMIAVAKLLEGKAIGLIAAGAGMIAVATAIGILAAAVKIFATMSWKEMGKGFLSVAAGLLIIAAAMKLMPPTMPLIGAGLLLVAIGMNILAGAMKVIATMSWGEIAKGLVGIAGALVGIGLAMNLMPSNMIITAAGLLLVSVSLIAIAKAMQMISGLSWGEIAKGLVGIAAALVILAAAMYAMSGSIVGAAAMAIAAASLLLLGKVLKTFAGISWGDLLHGLAGIAAMLALIAIAALAIEPAIPAMLSLGAALIVIGAGFTLFGLGAMLVAKAFEMLAKSGEKGSKAFVVALKNIGLAIPAFMTGFAKGLVDLANIFLQFAPVLVKVLVVVLSYLLDGLVKLIPKVLVIVGQLISGIIKLLKDKIPEYVLAGIAIIEALLKGIRDNIGKVVTIVGDIIKNFLDALAKELPKIVKSVADLIVAFFNSVAEAVGKVAGTIMFGIGISFLKGFMDGILSAQPGVTKWFTSLAGNVLKWIGNVASTLINKGKDLISGLYNGIVVKALDVIRWFLTLAGNVLRWIGNVVNTLKNKGIDFITGLYNGMVSRIGIIASWISGLAGSISRWIGNTLGSLYNAGINVIQGLWNGMIYIWNKLTYWISLIPFAIGRLIGNIGGTLLQAGRDLIQGFWNGAKAIWDQFTSWINGVMSHLPGPVKKVLGLGSPSRIFMEIGSLTMQGFRIGMEEEFKSIEKWLSTITPGDNINTDNMVNTVNGAITDMLSQIDTMPEMTPTITPVLDLTNVAAGAQKISDYISANQVVTPTYSYAQASTIAASTTVQPDDSIKAPTAPSAVKFEQNIYAPTQLSTSDIYKNTRNQITMAKQELSIP